MDASRKQEDSKEPGLLKSSFRGGQFSQGNIPKLNQPDPEEKSLNSYQKPHVMIKKPSFQGSDLDANVINVLDEKGEVVNTLGQFVIKSSELKDHADEEGDEEEISSNGSVDQAEQYIKEKMRHGLNPRSIKSAFSSRSSMGSKSLRQKAEFHFKKFMNLTKVRSLRRFYNSLLLNFICKAFYVFIVLLMLIIGISNLQDLWFPSVHYYNVIHIVINIVGHLLLLAVYDLCKVIHVTVLAGMVCRKGVTINNLSEGPFNGNIPGVKIRQIMMGLALFIEASIIVSSYYMDFTLTPSYYKTGMCIDATYPSFPPIPEGLMNHLLGNAESTNLHYTSLPLADGLVGGCAVWPLEDIPYDFEVKGPGSVYSATSYCYEEVGAKTKLTETRTKLIDMKESTHSVYGQILVQTPAGKMNSSIDVGFGVEQICTFSVKFGVGGIRSSFIVDEWHKLTLSKLLEIDIPNAPTVVKGDSNDIFERQISVHLQDDTYGFVPYIASMLDTLIGTNAQNSTEHEKILSYAALPDGLIYPDRMWNGVTVMLSIVTNYAMEQYEVTGRNKCDYYVWSKAGQVKVEGDYFNYTQILCMVEFCLMILTLGWVYLSYRIYPDSEAVYHSLISSLDFSNDFQKHNHRVFVDCAKTFQTLPGDLNERCGGEIVHYGIKKSTIESETPEMEFGSKKDVFNIRKFVKKKMRAARNM